MTKNRTKDNGTSKKTKKEHKHYGVLRMGENCNSVKTRVGEKT